MNSLGPTLKSFLQKTATLVATLILCLAAGEVALRLFTPFPITEISNTQIHPELGYVMNSKSREIDEYGFRNHDVTMEEAEIAVIGDSHTYGFNVASHESFPAVLARKTNRKTYNFAIGGYGIYHYEYLLDMAETGNFRDVILGFFPANDLFGYCPIVGYDYWREFARETGIDLPKCEGKRKNKNYGFLRLTAQKITRVIRYSATGSAIRWLLLDRIRNLRGAWIGVDSDRYFVFPHGHAFEKDRFAGSRRRFGRDGPYFDLNLVNGTRFLRESQQRFRERDIGFLVVIIPSFRRIMFQWSRVEGFDFYGELMESLAYELDVVRRFKAFFDDEGIAYIDALPHTFAAFQREIRAGRQFYRFNDGHPYAAGYASYADAAFEGLERLSER